MTNLDALTKVHLLRFPARDITIRTWCEIETHRDSPAYDIVGMPGDCTCQECLKAYHVDVSHARSAEYERKASAMHQKLCALIESYGDSPTSGQKGAVTRLWNKFERLCHLADIDPVRFCQKEGRP